MPEAAARARSVEKYRYRIVGSLARPERSSLPGEPERLQQVAIDVDGVVDRGQGRLRERWARGGSLTTSLGPLGFDERIRQDGEEWFHVTSFPGEQPQQRWARGSSIPRHPVFGLLGITSDDPSVTTLETSGGRPIERVWQLDPGDLSGCTLRSSHDWNEAAGAIETTTVGVDPHSLLPITVRTETRGFIDPASQ